MILYAETIHRLRNSISYTSSRKSVNSQNLFILDSTRSFVTLPVCPSITDILQINKAAATPSVTMGTWVLWDAAFSTVWISIGSKSIPCNNVSPEETERDKLRNSTVLHTLHHKGINGSSVVTRQGKEPDTYWEDWISQSICQSLLSLNFNYEKLDDNHFSPFLADRTVPSQYEFLFTGCKRKC